MQTYDQFVAAVDAEDLYFLNLFAQNAMSGYYTDPAAIAEMDARSDRILTQGYCLRVEHSRANEQGEVRHYYKAFLDPAIAGYVARAAKERVLLSRAPVPA